MNYTGFFSFFAIGIVLFVMMKPQEQSRFMLYDAASSPGQWYIVDDVVMGGRSSGSMLQLDDRVVFKGTVSLENNGGFSSTRLPLKVIDLEGYDRIVLKARAEGHRYQVRLKNSGEQRHSYIQYFVSGQEWTEHSFQLKDFYPTFRGRTLDLPNFNGEQLGEIGILIANKKAQDFRLEIKQIWLE